MIEPARLNVLVYDKDWKKRRLWMHVAKKYSPANELVETIDLQDEVIRDKSVLDLLSRLPNVKHVKGFRWQERVTPARADTARLAPLSLAISIDPSTHHVVPSVPRLRVWFDLDSLRQLDITLSHEDPELNSAALECVAGLLRALPRPTQLETLSITNSSLATVDLIDIFANHRLGLVIGRIQGLRTFSVMTNPVKAGRALHQLVQSLPDLSRLVTSDLVASLKGLSGGHAALRQIGLASVIGHVCARLDADSLRSDCDWCKLPRRGILQLLAVRNRFPALDTVVLQSSQQLPIAYDVASDGRFSFLRGDVRARIALGNLPSQLRQLDITLVDELGNVWRKEWDPEEH